MPHARILFVSSFPLIESYYINNILKLSNYCTCSVKFGYYLHKNVLLYSRIGGSFVNLRHNSLINQNKDLYGSLNISKQVTGLLVGLGIETNLTKQLSLSIDCELSFYESLKQQKHSIIELHPPLINYLPRPGNIYKSVRPLRMALGISVTYWM